VVNLLRIFIGVGDAIGRAGLDGKLKVFRRAGEEWELGPRVPWFRGLACQGDRLRQGEELEFFLFFPFLFPFDTGTCISHTTSQPPECPDHFIWVLASRCSTVIVRGLRLTIYRYFKREGLCFMGNCFFFSLLRSL